MYQITDNLKLTTLVKMNRTEPVLSDDDIFTQRMLREDVVDNVIRRDVLTLFNI